jgi:hypothetical protein
VTAEQTRSSLDGSQFRGHVFHSSP